MQASKRLVALYVRITAPAAQVTGDRCQVTGAATGVADGNAASRRIDSKNRLKSVELPDKSRGYKTENHPAEEAVNKLLISAKYFLTKYGYLLL